MAGHGVAPCGARGPRFSGAIYTYVLFAFIIVPSTQAMATGSHSSSLAGARVSARFVTRSVNLLLVRGGASSRPR